MASLESGPWRQAKRAESSAPCAPERIDAHPSTTRSLQRTLLRWVTNDGIFERPQELQELSLAPEVQARLFDTKSYPQLMCAEALTDAPALANHAPLWHAAGFLAVNFTQQLGHHLNSSEN